ncbi:hypothetical protein K4K56_005918 [Colletotrichum sp. SAR 10_98]|nr:hypothetical protein K4K56_005918 [Colletotrichum sp. SAR 10_98]
MDVDKESPGIGIGSACIGESDRSLAIPPKTYLVTLPRELVLEIINHCMRIGEHAPKKKRDVARLSLVTKFLREMCIPFIFMTMKIWTPYHKLLSKMRAIDGNKILHIVQHLEINLLSGGKNRAWKPETSTSLAILLSHMPCLNDLCLNLLHDRTFGPALEAQLLKKRVVLPAVKQFHYGFNVSEEIAAVNFIPKVFPQLDALHLNIGDQLHDFSLSDVLGLSKVTKSLNLKTVSLQKARWEFEHVSEIYDFFPDVTRLILNGEVDYDLTISELIPIFEPFQRLKVLALTDLVDPGELNVDDIQHDLIAMCEVCNPEEESRSGEIEPGDECDGNHYWEAYDLARESHEEGEDRGEDAKALFRMCPSLESVYFPAGRRILAHRFMPLKDESGDFNEVREETGLAWPAISEHVRIHELD